MKYLLIVAVFLLTAGCGNFRSSPPKDSPDRQPVCITEVDGVKVWVVKHYAYNNGDFHRVYFTTPSGHIVECPR